MKNEAIRLTTPYPSLEKMAKTLGASKFEISEARRLVRTVVLREKAATRKASPKQIAAKRVVKKAPRKAAHRPAPGGRKAIGSQARNLTLTLAAAPAQSAVARPAASKS